MTPSGFEEGSSTTTIWVWGAEIAPCGVGVTSGAGTEVGDEDEAIPLGLGVLDLSLGPPRPLLTFKFRHLSWKIYDYSEDGSKNPNPNPKPGRGDLRI